MRNLSNLPGWRTNSKIVVFESDDWGSIRMPSKESFIRLSESGIDLNKGDSERYNKYDSLASAEDLAALFEVLSFFKGSDSKNPVFTAVSVVANPNFDKIKAADYQQYYYEPFTDTLRRYNKEDSIDLWKEGIKSHLFIPQFHGREHLNVAAWMRALQRNDYNAITGFNEGFWGFRNQTQSGINFQSAFDLEKPDDINLQSEIIEEGLQLFTRLHGFKACFFVPPNGPFNESLIAAIAQNGIRFLSTSKIHHEPLGNGKKHVKLHYLGQRHVSGIHYLTRNASFEPSLNKRDWVDSCLNDINLAFKCNKPAVLSTHRVNYIGVLDPANRDHGLQQLKKLLTTITNKWQEVVFLTSDELGSMITKNMANAVRS